MPRGCDNYNISLPLGCEVSLSQAEQAGACLESPWISRCSRLAHKQQLGTQDQFPEETARFEQQGQAGKEALCPHSENTGLSLLPGVHRPLAMKGLLEAR